VLHFSIKNEPDDPNHGSSDWGPGSFLIPIHKNGEVYRYRTGYSPLVVAVPDGDDVILCQITSRQITDPYAIPLRDQHFSSGSLRQESNIRPNRLFTADSRIIQYRVGHLYDEHREQVIQKIIGILTFWKRCSLLCSCPLLRYYSGFHHSTVCFGGWSQVPLLTYLIPIR